MIINEIFSDEYLVKKIQKGLPRFFHLVELDSSRAGKIGMEVGSLREKVLIALLIYKFGLSNVDTDIPITEPEIDVKVFSEPISIKTLTSASYGGLKLSWTVDQDSAESFSSKYEPRYDLLFAKINWGKVGYLYYFPISLQKSTFSYFGRNMYLKMPKPGTNPRGVEMSSAALKMLCESDKNLRIEILWKKETLQYNPYQHWVEMWEKET